MSEGDYTNLDLDTAEQLLIEAGAPEQAEALRRYSHGIRNMMQSAIVPGFVRTLEIVVAKQIAALTATIAARDKKEFDWRVEWRERTDTRFDNFGKELDAGFTEVRGLRGDVTALQAEFQTVGETVDGLVQTVDELNARYGAQWTAATERIAAIEQILRERPAQREAEQHAIDARIGALEAAQQSLFGALSAESERRWQAMTEELRAQRVIIERKEVQIAGLAEELRALRAQTIADEISPDERRRLADTNRWLAEHRDQIVLKDAGGHGTGG